MNMQIDKELWNRVVIDNFGSPFHSWEWMRTIEEYGAKVKWFYLNDENGSAAIPIIVKYGVMGWIPFGIPFKGDLKYVKKKLKRFVLRSGLVGIITNNYEVFKASELPNSVFHFFLRKKTETITLSFEKKTDDELFMGFNSSTRKHIRRSIRSGVICEDFETDDYPFFFSEYIVFMKEKGLKLPISEKALLYLINLVNNKSSGLSIIIKKGLIKGERKGFLMVLQMGHRAHEFIRYDEPDFKNFYGPKLLTWEILKDVNKRGVSLYDFGGVSKQGLPGIYQYKIGFGGSYVVSLGFQICLPF